LFRLVRLVKEVKKGTRGCPQAELGLGPVNRSVLHAGPAGSQWCCEAAVPAQTIDAAPIGPRLLSNAEFTLASVGLRIGSGPWVMPLRFFLVCLALAKPSCEGHFKKVSTNFNSTPNNTITSPFRAAPAARSRRPAVRCRLHAVARRAAPPRSRGPDPLPWRGARPPGE
jgi:hypothetical protein